MARRRVLVLFSRSLMLRGLLHWLVDQEGIEILGLDAGVEQMNKRMDDFCPDAIIVDEEDVARGSISIAELMEHCPEAKLLQVDANSNFISVVQQQKIALTGVDDLLRLLTSS